MEKCTQNDDDERAQLWAALAALKIQVSNLEARLANPREQRASHSLQRHPLPRNLSTLEIPMAATRMVTAQMVSPAESNGLNYCVGGAVLSWIDVCAGLAAKTVARGPCVTASVDAVHFLRPCKVGSVVIVAAMVNRTFTSSMEVGVRVEEECPLTGARHHCCSAYLTFVAVSPPNSQGSSRRELPRVVPGASQRLHAVHAEAALRRQRRLEVRQRLRDDLKARAEVEACRLLPVTHRVGTPSLPPSLRIDRIDSSPLTSSSSSAGECSERACTRKRIAPSLTTAHTTQIIMPQHANSIAITFGGQVLKWVEQAAFVVATRVSRGGHVLTATMDDVSFIRSTKVGDTMYLEAQATAVFGSSVEVMISAWGEVPEEGVPFHCGDAFATIVSVDASGHPVDIPFEIVPEIKEEEMRFQGALARREARLALREALLRDKSKRLSLDDDDYGNSDDREATVMGMMMAMENSGRKRSTDVSEEKKEEEGEEREEENEALVQALAVA